MQFQELQDLGKPIQHLLSVSRIPAAQMTILQFIVGQFLTELQQQKKPSKPHLFPFSCLSFVKRCQNQEIITALRSVCMCVCGEGQKANKSVFKDSL